MGPIERTRLLVLNYNGRTLLEECLPSLVIASERSPVPCAISIIDNESTDDSLAWLATAYPSINIIRQPNRGLASFNSVLEQLSESAVLLLNQDVKLSPDAIGPLLIALESNEDALFSAPLCWTFDGSEYEGMRTRVRDRFGMVQGMSRVPGFATKINHPDLTAAAGPILAVDRLKFLAVGGYDPLYFPGRIEDLDLGFRGWMTGYRGYYLPESIAYHQGFASFGPAFGREGCDYLAARNTLLFAWKNLSGPRLASHFAWLGVRLLHASLAGHKVFLRAFRDAWARRDEVRARREAQHVGMNDWTARQEAFFQRFAW